MFDGNTEFSVFIRDRKTGRYCRENSEGCRRLNSIKLKEETPQVENNKRPKTSNVLNYMRTRELGQISGLHAELEYFKMRTCNSWLRNEVSLKECQSHNIVSVHMIKGSVKSVFGVWNLCENSDQLCLIGERSFVGQSDHQNLSFIAWSSYIIDMCDGPEYTLVCLMKNPYSCVGRFAFIPKASSTEDTEDTDPDSFFLETTNFPVFCCAAGRTEPTFALGTEGCIKFYNSLSYEKYFPVRGNIYTISFDESSNLMVSGTHLGNLCVHDIRQKELQGSIKVSSNAITDSCFLDSDQIIVAGRANVLSKIDLRMKKVVTEYFGHKTALKKRPFSFANNMLCATGSDNIIRIWHVSGGNPIHEMKPVMDAENAVGSWLYGDCNKTYLYQFEEHFERIYEIA